MLVAFAIVARYVVAIATYPFRIGLSPWDVQALHRISAIRRCICMSSDVFIRQAGKLRYM